MARRAYLKQAAEELQLPPHRIRQMAKRGEIPCFMCGNRYVFDIDQCEEFLRNKAMENVKNTEPVGQYGVLRKIACD